jgi:predicted amidohydrolase YtcJ
MYTCSATRLSFDEEQRGTLTDGKVADFVVLDRNPLTQKPEDLKDIKVLQFYLKGQTYEPSIRTPADLCIRACTNILLNR